MERKKKLTYKHLFVNLLAELGWLITGTEQLKECVQEEVVALRICYKGLQDVVEQYEHLYGQRFIKIVEENEKTPLTRKMKGFKIHNTGDKK